MSDVYKSSFSQFNGDKKQLLLSIEEQNKRVQKARELLLNDAIEPADFKAIKTESEQAINRAEAKLTEITTQKDDKELLLENACKTLGELDTLYTTSDTAVQRRIFGSIYPEKLVFENNQYRTTRLNRAVQLKYSMNKGFRENEKGETANFDDFSCMVAPTRIELVSKV